jgi:lipopolysaccharide heptosyltransferase II
MTALPVAPDVLQPPEPPQVDDWTRLGSILAIRCDALGDVLMTTPAIRAVRQSARGARLTLLTSTAGAAVAPFLQDLDDLRVWDPPWMKATTGPQPAADRAWIERLRRERFDAAIVFTVHTQSPLPAALACHLAGIPRVLAHCRENPYHLLSPWIAEPEPDVPLRHEVRRQLDLVAHVGCATDDERLAFRVPPDATRTVRDVILPGLGLDPRDRWLVIHPGASAPSRRYRPESFAAAGARLACDDGWRIVVTGSPGERPLADDVVAGIRGEGGEAASLAGALSLAELAALLSVAPLLVSGNTGPVHLAAAVGTPVVDVYALTNLQHTPWRVAHRVVANDVPCRGCHRSVCPEGHHACLAGIEPGAVVAAVRDLADELAATPPGRPAPSSLTTAWYPAAPPAAPVAPMAEDARHEPLAMAG